MKNLLLIFSTFTVFWCSGQSAIDTVAKKDSTQIIDSAAVLPVVKDSISRDSVVRDSLRQVAYVFLAKKLDTAVYSQHPFYKFSNPTRLIASKRVWNGKEGVFYAIIALLLFFALAKNAFSRYINDLFRVFFRTTFKQRQTREQLLNAPLPSLLFNILYVLSAGLFITLLFQRFNLGSEYGFWMLFAYCVLGLLVVYAVKFVALKVFGWLLKVGEATDTYIFIVFTTNKVIGISLLPFIIGLAFMDQAFYEAAFILSLFLVAALFVYRFYLSYVSVQKSVKINFFHFVLYLAAFEIAPLLLINKLLLRFLGETY